MIIGRIVAALLLLVPLSAAAQKELVPNASLCEMVAAPERFVALRLVVRGDVQLEADDYTISDPHCQGQWMSFDFGPGMKPGTALYWLMTKAANGGVRGVLLYGHLDVYGDIRYPRFIAERVLAFPKAMGPRSSAAPPPRMPAGQ